MSGRIAGLVLVLAGASVAWVVLTGVLAARTAESDGAQQAQLGALWGPEQTQTAPQFSSARGRELRDLPIEASRIAVNLQLEQRRKGLLWYNTYGVDFSGSYRVTNASTGRIVKLMLKYPAQNAVFDDVRVLVDDKPVNFSTTSCGVVADVPIAPGHSADVTVGYSTRGIHNWSYQFGSAIGAVRNFDLTMSTNFNEIDFPAQTLAPTVERPTSEGWQLGWHFRNLVAANGIGMLMPERLQPGPVAQRITAWAPLSLFFYFFVMFILCSIRRIDLHPMNYFFLAAAFFAFHLLFAYTVDRIPLGIAFALCSLVSMFLTISYLRIVASLRFAAVEAALAQFFYLVLFSLALFNEGYSGLAITVGSIITLFVTMQLTARIRWADRFAVERA
jgi:inner membrane protein CreD